MDSGIRVHSDDEGLGLEMGGCELVTLTHPFTCVTENNSLLRTREKSSQDNLNIKNDENDILINLIIKISLN